MHVNILLHDPNQDPNGVTYRVGGGGGELAWVHD